MNKTARQRTEVAQSSTPDTLAQLFTGLAEPTRLRLLSLLIHNGETCVCDLVDATELNQTTVSRHLAVLRHAGLVRGRKEGLWVHYSVARTGSKLQNKLIAAIKEAINGTPQLARDLGNLKKSACGSSSN
jgi:ArsR family transcriptional regulator